jgi:hypothetical protein
MDIFELHVFFFGKKSPAPTDNWQDDGFSFIMSTPLSAKEKEQKSDQKPLMRYSGKSWRWWAALHFTRTCTEVFMMSRWWTEKI